MISHWLGWISLLILIGELFVLIARRSSKGILQQLRGKHHMVWGKIAILIGFFHGILVGPQWFLHLNWGTISWLCMLLLLCSYQFRKKLGKHWFNIHKIITVILILAVCIHVFLEVSH